MSSMSVYDEQYEVVAKDILNSIGAIEICPSCEIWWRDNGMEEKEVYSKATSILKSEYPDMNDFTLFHEKIKYVLDYASYDNACPFCYKD
ncbi:MAG: hypothetical protein HDT23_01840 [Ruminococcus sp.]|nr:hypothetical protein [Ruminococcus sp.]